MSPQIFILFSFSQDHFDRDIWSGMQFSPKITVNDFLLSRPSLQLYPVLRLMARRLKTDRRHRARCRSNLKIADKWKKNEFLSAPSDACFDIVAGPIGDASGLGRAARYEIAHLNTTFPPKMVIDTTKDQPGEILHRIFAGSLAAPKSIFFIGQPDTYERTLSYFPLGFLDQSWRVGHLVWEMPRFPKQWKFLNSILHRFQTPSLFSATAISSGLDLPCEISPYKVKLPPPSSLTKTRLGIEESAFLGVSIMDLRSCPARKNPLAHLHAWKMAFGNDVAFQLLIKAQFTKSTAYIRQQMLQLAGQNIRLIEGRWSDEDIAALFYLCDVYLSLHRAEGFGLTIREALEAGAATVTTNWSGPTDYLQEFPKAFPVPYSLQPYRDVFRHYEGEDLYWAEPELVPAVNHLKYLSQVSS
jgi:glycosyltransferase involved in cell wall biosynthesis